MSLIQMTHHQTVLPSLIFQSPHPSRSSGKKDLEPARPDVARLTGRRSGCLPHSSDIQRGGSWTILQLKLTWYTEAYLTTHPRLVTSGLCLYSRRHIRAVRLSLDMNLLVDEELSLLLLLPLPSLRLQHLPSFKMISALSQTLSWTLFHLALIEVATDHDAPNGSS